MKILVMDDNANHRQAATEQLTGHELTVFENYNDCVHEIISHSYDVVLVDLLMPAGFGGLRKDEEMPIGIFIALLAAKNGAKYVAVHTDSDHHSHPASACLDDFNPPAQGKAPSWGEYNPTPFNVEGARVLLSNNRKWMYDEKTKSVVKRWDLLLEYLLKE